MIPAILAITTNTFIVITSNLFAILGLRSLYFLLAEMMEKFYYLKPGLAAIQGCMARYRRIKKKWQTYRTDTWMNIIENIIMEKKSIIMTIIIL